MVSTSTYSILNLDYPLTSQGRGAKGTTVIHQCHVCNRKFKKKIDRDRHLFIHDIKDLPHVQQVQIVSCVFTLNRFIPHPYLFSKASQFFFNITYLYHSLK